MTEVKKWLRIMVHEVFVIISLFCVNLSDQTDIQEIIKDVAVHEGYRIKYTFKDHYYLDVEIFPQPNFSDWFALVLSKDVAGGNRMSLQVYNGNDFETSDKHHSYVNVGNCNQIKTFIDHENIFIIPVSCNSNGTDVILLNNATLKKLQFLPHSAVEDAHYWRSVYSDKLNLVLVTNQKTVWKSPAVVFHYVLDEKNKKFVEKDRIKEVDPHSVTAFVINDESYVAVSNYRNSMGKFVDSVLYVQDNDSGRLMKYQDLKTTAAISFTYFCYVSETKTEHFLLATNNKRIKGFSKLKNTGDHFIEESLMFKWDKGSFIPFQTLMVRLPSPWIMIPSGSNNNLVLITWSYVDGITSYQYNGWRFKRTAQDQKDIINSPPSFVRLKTVSIAGEILFTIFLSKGGAKKKYFFVPVFKDNIKTRMDLDEKTNWCKIANQELRLATSEAGQHYLLLSRIKPNGSPLETISSLFNVIFGFNPPKNSFDSNLQVMSQQGSAPGELMRSQITETLACEASTEVHQLHKVSYMIGLKQGILGIKYPATIVYYPVSRSGINISGIEMYKLKDVSDITSFKLVKLCNGQGVFIQGIQKGKLFARIFKIATDIDPFELSSYTDLNITKETNSIIGMCSKNEVDRFITIPASRKGICTIHSGMTSTYFHCDPTMELLNNSIISISPNNHIIRTTIGNNDSKAVTIKEVEKSSNIFIDTSENNIFLLISSKHRREICIIQEPDNVDMKSVCKETTIKKTEKNKIRFGLVRGEAAAFIGFQDHIDVHILSEKHIFTLKVNNKYNEFEPFSVNGVHFLSLSSYISTTLIEYTPCLP